MIKRLLKGKFESNNQIIEEEFESNNQIIEEEFEYYYDESYNAFEIYQNIIQIYNDEELRRKTENKDYPVHLRKAISAEWIDNKIVYCQFQKQNCGTLKDSKGYYDRCKCLLCGRVVRRRNIDSSDVSKIICKTDKKNSLLYEKNRKKLIKKVWCSNCQQTVDKCNCLKKNREWN